MRKLMAKFAGDQKGLVCRKVLATWRKMAAAERASKAFRGQLDAQKSAQLEKILAIAGPSDRSVGFAFECKRARGEPPGRSTPATAGSVLVTAVPVACPCSGGCRLRQCLCGDIPALESAIGDVGGGAGIGERSVVEVGPSLQVYGKIQ